MRRLIFALLAMLFGLLTALAWYVCDHGFTRKWRNYLVEQFRKEGVEVSFRRVTLDPFRGLVARNVVVYDALNHHHVLAEIDQAMLGVNYANAVRGRTFLDWIDLHDTHVTLPVDPSDPAGETVPISHLNARLFFPPNQIYLAHADADFAGVHIVAAGSLANPQEFPLAHGNMTAKSARSHVPFAPGEFIARLAQELRSIAVQFAGGPPLIDIRFLGDLASPADIRADLRVQAVDVRVNAIDVERKKYRIQRLDLAASCRSGVVALQQFDVVDPHGEMHASGSYQIANRELSLRLKSSLDAQAFKRAFHLDSALGDIDFQDPPAFEFTLQGKVGSENQWKAFGHLDLRNFSFKSEPFTRLSADASWDGARWSVRDLILHHVSGEVRGDAMQLPGEFRARLRGGISPKAFLPLLSGSAAEWLSQFEFADAPKIDLRVEGQALAFEQCNVSGDVNFGRTLYRGMLAKGSAGLAYSDLLLTIAPFPSEDSNQSITFDFRRNEVRLNEDE